TWVVPSTTMDRAIHSDSAREVGPSSTPGRIWQCRSIIPLLVPFSLDVDDGTHDPQVVLIQPGFPAGLEVAHPGPVLLTVRHIHDDADEVVPVQDATVPPVALDALRLVAGRPETINDFEDGVGKPLLRHLAAVVKLEGEEYLEAPIAAAHRSPSP